MTAIPDDCCDLRPRAEMADEMAVSLREVLDALEGLGLAAIGPYDRGRAQIRRYEALSVAAPHSHTGNCWDDVPVRDGNIVDVCEKHDEPRGRCSECGPCPTCVDGD